MTFVFDLSERAGHMTSIGEDGRVEFRFYRSGATDVRVVSDVIGWSAGQQMSSEGDGWWTVVTKLACGEYGFHYVADGELYADYAAHGVHQTSEGWESQLWIPWVERNPSKQQNSNATKLVT